MTQQATSRLASVDELIEEIRQGRMVILMDDEGRENEGDLIMAAECVEASHINFMARYACGLICQPMRRPRCEQLGLALMVEDNGSGYGTRFTVSIEAARGVSTGISAADRARTVRAAAAPDASAADIVQPGHIFPLMAEAGGVLRRAGHTEAACDLAGMAGFEPTGVICEVMNDDGTMARRPELERFAAEHGIRMGTIADLIHYRIHNEQTVEHIESHPVETDAGSFQLHCFRDLIQGEHHLALVKGSPESDRPTTVRVHVADPLRDLLGLRREGCQSWSARDALGEIAGSEAGVLILLADQPGRVDFRDRLDLLLERSPQPRNPHADGTGSYLDIGTGAQILRSLGVGRMRLLSSPWRFSALAGFGLEVVEQLGSRDESPGQGTAH